MPANVDLIASYVPGLLVRRLAREPVGPSPERVLQAERMPAAALFADISGYTLLTEQLGRQGAPGIEVLSNLLNAFFGRVIERVRAHGGDVAKFAGDALLAVWPVGPSDPSLSLALVRAAACAFAVQQVLHDQELAPGVKLSLRVGVGSGELVATPVGGVRGRSELFVGGDAVARAALAVAQARPGEVAVSSESVDLLAERVRVKRARGVWLLEGVDQPLTLRTAPVPPVTPPMAQAIRAFVPGVVRARFDAGQEGFEAELRRITAVFVHLRDLDPRDAALSNRIFSLIQDETYRFEGAIHHLSVDEKGPALVLAFGLPPLAHEDDPCRAALAALAVHAALDELGLRVGLGVATGDVFCGSVGHERRREYTVVGAAMVRAARLMVAAGDGVLCDQTTWEGARDRVKFDGPIALTVKSQTRPLMVYRATARRRLAAMPGAALHALVGRRAEREVLRRELLAVRDTGASSLVAVEADHGYGKSHLMDELAARARELGVTILRGAADAVEAATPYYAWRRVLASDLPAGGTGGDSMVLQANLLQTLTSDSRLLPFAPLLDAVVPMGLPDNDITRQLSGEARASATRDLLVRVIERMARKQALVIVLEDVHWMDSASYALAVAVMRRVRPLLLAVTARTLEGDRGWADLAGAAAQVNVLRLGPLPPDEVASLLCQQLDVDRVPRPVLDLVYERAGGHPHFSLEVAYALLQSGVLRIDDGTTRLEAKDVDLHGLELPETVQGLVRSRIDRLPPEASLLLKVASVIGRTFQLRLLHQIFPVTLDRPELKAQLESLERASLVVPVKGAVEPTWAFRDAITQQVAYNLTLSSQRKPLHLALARAYEDVHPSELPRYNALIAHHWREAGEPGHAIYWLERAGEQAVSGGAWREVAGFFTDALVLNEAQPVGSRADTSTRARWERLLGLAQVHSGRSGEGRAHLERCLALLGWSVPSSRPLLLVGIALQLVLWAIYRGVRPRPLPETGRARRLEAVRAYETLTEVCYFDQRVPETFFCVLRTLNLAGRLGPCAELARGQANEALGCAALPWPAGVASALGRAAATARAAGSKAASAWVSFVEGQIDLATGRWDEALVALGRATNAWRDLGDQRHLALGMVSTGIIYFHRGEDAEALRAMDEVYQAGERCSDPTFLSAGLRGRAMVMLRRGRPGEAVPILEQAMSLLNQNTSRITEMSGLGELAVALWRSGRRDEGLAAARRAASLIGGSRPTAVNAFTAYSGVAEVLLEAAISEANQPGPQTGLAAEAGPALDALERFAHIYPIARPNAALRRGQWLLLKGRNSAAWAVWKRALKAASGARMPFEVARLHLALGAGGPPDERPRHQAEAQIVLAALNAWDEERTVLKRGGIEGLE